MIDAPERVRAEDVAEVAAYERKMMRELPYHLCRQRIDRVKAGYIERYGMAAAKHIHAAMAAEYKARKAPR